MLEMVEHGDLWFRGCQINRKDIMVLNSTNTKLPKNIYTSTLLSSFAHKNFTAL